MEYFIIALVFIAVLGYLVWDAKKDKEWKDIDIPMPETLRNDLLYGYYSSEVGQWEATKDHVNLFWYSHFSSWDEFLWILKNTDKTIVLDLAPYLSKQEGKKKVCREDAVQALTDCFMSLKDHGVLHRIKYLYPIDEPSLSVKNPEEHKKMLQTVIEVRNMFDDLKDSKIAVIYLRGGESNFWNLPYHDVVGVDNYEQKSEVLTKGDYAKLKSMLQYGQTTMLVPGPAFGQKPDPFVAYAHSNPEVEMVIPFVWFDRPKHKDVEYTGLEAADAVFYQKWINAGMKVINK